MTLIDSSRSFSDEKMWFSMIELVFIIVVLGLLAAIAILKLSRSRVDTKAVLIAHQAGYRDDHSGARRAGGDSKGSCDRGYSGAGIGDAWC